MTQRFTPLARDALAPDQRLVYDAIVAGPRGTVPAPFQIFLQSAPLADRVQQLGSLLRYGTSLPPRLSELAILVTANHWRAAYEWSVHVPEALKAGVSQSTIDAISAGRRPEFDGDDALIYDFATEFYRTRDVPDELFAAAIARFGRKTVVELASILGYYSMLAIVLNLFHVEAAGQEPV
jgi:4-carboxymuconolactone decarboxylase